MCLCRLYILFFFFFLFDLLFGLDHQLILCEPLFQDFLCTMLLLSYQTCRIFSLREWNNLHALFFLKDSLLALPLFSSFPCVNEIICITLLRLVCVSSAHSSSHLQFFSAPLLVLLKFWSTLFPSDLFSYNLRVWCSAYFNFSNQAGPPKKERTPPPPPPAPPLEKRSSPTRY